MPAGRHGSYEDAVVRGVCLHPDTVAQDGSAGNGAGRIHGHDRDRTAGAAKLRDKRGHERALARPRRPGDADQLRAAGNRVEAAQGGFRYWGSVLDGGQQTRQCSSVTRKSGVAQAGGKLSVRIGHAGRS